MSSTFEWEGDELPDIDAKKRNRNCEVRVSPFLDGNEIYMAIMIEDTTNHDQFIRLKEKNRYKKSLMMTISHELRTPLNCIIAMLDCLKSEISVGLAEEYVSPALASAKLLINLINDILDWGQIKAGKLRLTIQKVALKKEMQATLDLLSIQARSRGLKLELSCSSICPSHWHTDPNRLRQIIMNIVYNSLKFTAQGGVSISLDLLDSKHLLINVSDTGIGIKDEDLNKLFKPFSKLDLGANKNMNPQGAGLGLQISQMLAVMLGPEKDLVISGEPYQPGIKVKSAVGMGTTFSFVIEDRYQVDAQEIMIMGPGSHEQIIKSFVSPAAKKPAEMIDHSFEEIALILPSANDIGKVEESRSNAESEKPQKSIHDKIRLAVSGSKSRDCQCSEALLIDDNDFNLFALKKLLQSYKIHADTFINGSDAIKAYSKQPRTCCRGYRIVFLDCNMPVLSGQDVARELRRIEKLEECSAVPIIATTAAATWENQGDCIESGMNDFLAKPVEKKALERLLLHWLIKEAF
jgi:signal transduction histidine kinase/CheY-like chemotaxis protein